MIKEKKNVKLTLKLTESNFEAFVLGLASTIVEIVVVVFLLSIILRRIKRQCGYLRRTPLKLNFFMIIKKKS